MMLCLAPRGFVLFVHEDLDGADKIYDLGSTIPSKRLYQLLLVGTACKTASEGLKTCVGIKLHLSTDKDTRPLAIIY